MNDLSLNKILEEYTKSEYLETPFVLKMLHLLLEYWAREKDYELRNNLLSELVMHYSSGMRRLAECSQVKDRFIRTAAHDLSSPLVGIRGLSAFLLTETIGPLTDEQKEFLSTIDTASTRVLSIVNDLLDISLFESGRLKLQLSRGSLEELIKERVLIHNSSAVKKNITLHTSYSKFPEQLFDWNKIAQVIDNLISNAVKYSPHNSNIHITLDRKGTMLRVSVKDEGPGILEADQSRIFNEFEKVAARPTGGEKSTGLGLSIAKKFVEMHRGTLRVDSKVGVGTTLSFTLPLEDESGKQT